ncbi:MAG: DUF3098 domain-containing protein [Bacteroidota bacterium]
MEIKKKTTAAPAAASKTTKPVPQPKTGDFALGRENYIIMIVGLGLIALGFLLMIGGNSKDPNVFSDEIFSFRRLTLAPILVLAGYVVEIFAIMKKPKDITPE